MKSIVTARMIYVSFDPRRTCEAIGSENGTIVAVGTREDVIRKVGNDAQLIDLPDSVIMPGFVDAHMHLDDFGKYLSIIDLRGTRSIEEMKRKISQSGNDRRWVLGHGWDQDLFSEKRWPNKNDLDAMDMGRPVFLSRVDLHSAVLNSEAIREMKLEEKFSEDEDLVRDSNGRLTGIVREKVFGYADDWIKEHTPDEEWEKMLENGIAEANRLGVTAVGFMSCSTIQYAHLLRIKRKKGISLRIHAYISSEEFANLKYANGDEFLRISGVKAFGDGSLGSRTALLSFPYSDDTANYGAERESMDSIYESGKLAGNRGMDIGTHAIGDRALDNVLSVYEKLASGGRIEHASLIRKDQLARIRKCKVTLVVQPHFVITDFWTLDRIGRENSGMAYPFGTVLREGIPMALSTDCPVENLNPWETVYATVTRGKNDGIPLGRISGTECLSADQALRLYTEGSASALRNTRIGSLREGNKADFIALDSDPLALPDDDLGKIKVTRTWVDGGQVWPR